uniref:Carboxylic ester hydrolase n=2 Tax=Lygus hesperus TaxID=30085 RepID=A0A0A9X4W0_LYGHE
MFKIFLLASLTVGALSVNSSGPIIDTPLGQVLGWERLSRDGRWYQAWTGIPYAQPPVGKLRFMAPVPAQKWSGILNATGDTPMCYQQSPFPGTQSEDCLYLSVYRPKNGMIKMPVLLRVHGGAFQAGEMGPRENADFLMDEDVVLVQIQYRLNGFGFMSLGDKIMPGNFGIKDQVMALKWVQKNIAAFGGDANSVTVIGESAGAASTHFLLKTPAADGLVHRAVSDSGTVNRMWSLLSSDIVRNATLVAAEKVGCNIRKSNQEILQCIQQVAAPKLLAAMGPTAAWQQTFAPCIEPKDAEDAVATEDISMRPVNKPWITSNANGEYTLFKRMSTPQQIAEYHRDLDGYLQNFIRYFLKNPEASRVSEGSQLLKNHYFPVMDPIENFTIEVAEVTANFYFPYAAFYNLLMHQGPKWYYYFEYVGELSGHNMSQPNANTDVAGHAEQMNYYFNFGNLRPGSSRKGTPEDYKVSKRMIKYLVNFAYYDDPTPPGSPMKWKQFNGQEFLRISNSRSDSMADESVVQKLLNVLNLWSYVVGWEL